jgi:hypothetical protein
MRILWAILLLIATPAYAADQFDLVCSDKISTVRYRVDLQRGEWCFGECRDVQKFASVTSGTLTLSERVPTLPGGPRSYNRISRQTGEWRWYNYDPRYPSSVMDRAGTCQPAEFSGFPVSKF